MDPKKVKPTIAQDKLGRFELSFLLFILALVVFFHLVLQKYAGAFWRDECSSIVLARAKSWTDLWAGLFTDSFPALWVMLLRFWDMAVAGSGEGWLRSIGFWLSLGGIASLWLTAKSTKLAPPLLAIALIAFNPAVFYWGDSLRAYALAMILVILLFGFVWKFCEEGGKKHFIVALVAAILAAQSNYQSSYLILAICSAGALVCLVERRRWRGTMVLGIGFVAALSMIPYRPVIQQYSEPAQLISVPNVTASMLWQKFSEGFDSTIGLIIWAELYGLCLALPVYYWFSKAHKENRETFRRGLYAATASFVAPVGCYFFARKAGFSTQSWYYIPILGLFALAIEMSLTGLIPQRRPRQIRLILAVLVVLASIAPVWKHAHLRRTSMDIAASKVAASAAPEDFVLVNPFWEVASFQYYYKGKAPWSILPVVADDQRALSFLATKPLMTSPEPLKVTYERMEKALRNGGKVWVVGGLPKGTTRPPDWIPAPHPVHGWQSWAYMEIWALETAWYAAHHARERTVVPVKSDQEVSRFENVESIVVFSGWKDSATDQQR